MAPRGTGQSNQVAKNEFVTQVHPLYTQWQDTWQLARDAYEGDNGFMDGTHLVPHPREMVYPLTDGHPDTTKDPIDVKDKFKRRQQLARYENYAELIVRLFVDHQYVKGVSRLIEGLEKSALSQHPLFQWYQDVDGQGTHIDDWMKQTQAMANVFGHIFVVMDRTPRVSRPRSAAEEGPIVLRRYVPLDALDWLAPNNRLTAIKFVEAVERTSLREASSYSPSVAVKDRGVNLLYRFFTERDWQAYDTNGKLSGSGTHNFGELPVLVFYARERVSVPIIGRSLLPDPKLFKDHYNLISELREVLRAQAFSIFNIQLGPDETLDEARGRLGDHAGVDTVVFTKGPAEFIAPADGPVGQLADEILRVRASMLRLVGINPEASDSNAPETEGSRRIKAMDLNRVLSGLALGAQKFEYRLARLWFIAMYGQAVGVARWKSTKLNITHPTEFFVEELASVINETLSALEIPLGDTFSAEIRKRAVPRLLRDLSVETQETINSEIDALVKEETEQKRTAAAAAAKALESEPLVTEPPAPKNA